MLLNLIENRIARIMRIPAISFVMSVFVGGPLSAKNIEEGNEGVVDQTCIPIWEARGISPRFESSHRISRTSAQGACDLTIEFGMSQSECAVSYDPDANVSSVFVGDFGGSRIVRHDIDAELTHTAVPLAISYGIPWIARDLDVDGAIELVIQRGDPLGGPNGYLDIQSAPDWDSRGHFVLPGMKVYMYPVAVNLDDDSALEIYFTPAALGGEPSRAIIIDYNPDADSFAVIADIPAPNSTGGPCAYGDFDQDGRVEFISGTYSSYSLFEFDGATLHNRGLVGDPFGGFCATAAKPKPNGLLHALLGSSPGGAIGFRYQLLEPVGDNLFVVSHVFQENTGWSGITPCHSADVDCDGLDELSMSFYPVFKVLEWDEEVGDFVEGCLFDGGDYGSLRVWRSVDLDQNLIPEWGTVNHEEQFRAFSTECTSCREIPQTPRAWWPLDEDNIGVAEEVWVGNDGEHLGSPKPVAGKVGMGLAFDGGNDWVRVPDAVALHIGTGDVSVDAWFNTADGDLNPIIGQYDCLNERGWVLWLEQGATIGFRLGDGEMSDYLFTAAASVSDGLWHHVALTVDRDLTEGIRAYLDGELVGIADPTAHQGSITSSTFLGIGAGYTGACDWTYFDGILDEVRVYASVLDRLVIRSVVAVDSFGNCKPTEVVCQCPSQGDVEPDGFLTAIDLAGTIDALFAGGSNPQDIYCPTFRFDVDCDEFTTAIDLSILIDHLFAGGGGPCDPCGS